MNLFNRIAKRFIRKVTDKKPSDFAVGGHFSPYLLRWYVIPRNPIFNIYLHKFLRDDDDRALHDHPWCSVSLLLEGGYVEHRILAGGIHQRKQYNAGNIKCMSGAYSHRVEVLGRSCWTLFFTGPVYRKWGFHCPKGWVYWEDFVSADDRGSLGKGCDQ